MSSAAYTAVLRELCREAPRYGFATAREVPRISDEQLAVILHEHPDLAGETLAEMDGYLIAALESTSAGRHSAHTVWACVGYEALERIRKRAASWILSDLRTEFDAQEEDDRNQDAFQVGVKIA